MHTPNLVDSNIERLAELFPNCITEKPKTDEQGKVIRDMNGEVVLERGIDFELLKQELSHSVIDGSQERYRLDWVGKREAIVTANSPIAKTLRPCRAESVDFDTTGNLFIEGDNLEALKLLQESYLGKVKMIYIDPPYNTGNDFIYNDDFAADTAEFFERSGQVDADGNRLVANTESNGRFHSDWLSMMYSRLKLARNLLSDDGVIFISIDDNEQANLKKLANELFGNENVEVFIWNKEAEGKSGTLKQTKRFRKVHEYIIVAYKNIDLSNFNKIREALAGKEDTLQTANLAVNADRENTTHENYFTITNPNGLEFTRQWKWNKSYIEQLIKDDLIYWGSDGNKQPRLIIPTDDRRTTFLESILNYGGTTVGRKDFEDLMGEGLFTYPKPLILMKKIMESVIDKDDSILDFFAGSSTTAHAVMQLNAEDGGNRQFIMVQIPENTDPKSEAFKAGYPTIAEISKERIRRAGAKIKSDNADKDLSHLDTGFRVLKIDTSNMNDIYYRPQDYNQDLLATLENNIKPDRSDEDLLFQFMLDTGVPLSLPIERTELSSKSGGHTIYQVGGNSLIASLDYIDANMVNDIAALNPLKFITSERAIATDSDKTNIKERFKQLSPHTDVRFI
ncbi:site-specific DNA-methyltransferase [Enhydrobacter sp. H5]|nr:site-specific DNA-methyltransferase [Enhydrobacter sp. H5]